MSDGEKEMSIVDRIGQLDKEGLTVDQIVELLNRETAGSNQGLRWDASKVSRFLRICRSSTGEPSVPETEPKPAIGFYMRVSTLGQEDAASLAAQKAACVELAESLGYRIDHVYVEGESKGDVDA